VSVNRLSIFILFATALGLGCSTPVAPRAPGTFTPANVTAREPAAVTAPPKKVIIFYSSVGMGHLSAARSIQKRILAENAGTEVVLKDIRDFLPKFYRTVGEKLFWVLAKKYPDTFDSIYRSTMSKGRNAKTMEDVSHYYTTSAVLQYIKEQNPEVVVATHYGSAQVLGDLRDQHELTNIRIGWLNTDYIEGYFPRISARVDQSFLPHQGMEEIWERAGVDPSKFATTGMPLDPSLFEPIDRGAFMKSKGLNPDVRTLVLASGGEGVGDFPAIVKSISEHVKDPLQIVAVCAKNEAHFKNLTALKASLPENIHLTVLGFIPVTDLLNYEKSAEYLITKPGGLSPTEGFALMKKMLLLKGASGHEQDNADFFEKRDLAISMKDEANAGEDLVALMKDEARGQRMLDAQAKFRETLDVQKITDFVFTGKNTFWTRPENFGQEGGTAIEGGAEALRKLAADSPADMEILLSYSKLRTANPLNTKENPFGHIAVKVGDDVYTVNHIAKPGSSDDFLAKVPLADYLYSTEHWGETSEAHSTTAISYARDVIGVRVQGLTDVQKKAMFDEIATINEKFHKGELKYELMKYNCTDATEQVLNAGGFNTAMIEGPRGKISMPLDLFDRELRLLQSRPELEAEFVNYIRIPDALNEYRLSQFPLSIKQLRRSIGILLGKTDPIETFATKRVSATVGDQKLHYENLDNTSKIQEKAERAKINADFESRMAEIRTQEAAIEKSQRELTQTGSTNARLKQQMDGAMSDLTADQRRLIGTAGESKLPETIRARLAIIRMHIAETISGQAKLQSSLDDLIVKELDVLAEQAIDAKRWTLARAKKLFTTKQLRDLNRLSSEADTEYQKFLSAKILYGQPKDQTRISAYRDLFAKLRDFSSSTADLYTLADTLEKKSFLLRVREMFSALVTRIRQVASLSDSIWNTLSSALFPKEEVEKGSLALTKSIISFGRKSAQIEKVSVEVFGRENIPKLATRKTINIFTPTHRHPMNDVMVMSEIIPEDALIFAVPEYFTPKPIAKALARTDGFVAVGSSRDPISNAMAQINAGKSQNVLLYPEGSVSIALQETRPTRTKFSTGFIRELQSQGYEVNIIPIVYTNSATPLSQNGIGTKILQADIIPAIDDAQIKLIMEQGDLALGQYIRGTWLERLPLNEREFSGQLRFDHAKREFESYVKGSEDWQAVCGGLFTTIP
jgi:processive 1,2-diacylglycerol beta-glucosyltransferase